MSGIALVDEFAEFRSDLVLHCAESGESSEDALFAFYSRLASENGDCPDLAPCHILSTGRSGYRVDGWAFDSDRGTLYLAILDPRPGEELETLNAAQLESLTSRVRRFVEFLLSPPTAERKDDARKALIGDAIAATPALIKRVQILVFSEARLSTRRAPELSGEVQGRPIVSNVLDFARYAAISSAKGEAEPIEIDFQALTDQPIPCLPASSGTSRYSAYLLAFPGEVLAQIYSLYGPRLLEQNVRTFLQARTKVNRGIIATLRDNPQMFFAYNNGLTATATSIEAMSTPDGYMNLSRINDLQIVNGGQTTASVLYAHDLGADLSEVFVQMKLSVVEPALVEEIVPLISRYANTQNRISEADFFSSHPFHVTMEQASRRVAPPPKAGSLTGQKWFYERARGQYRDARSRCSAAQKKRFDTEFPRSQLLEKTDLGKYEMIFAGRPHIACLGALKSFLKFAEQVAKDWEATPQKFNDGWFRNATSRALIFRWTDKMIAQSDWYKAARGHKAQTVAYTLAWLQEHLKKTRNGSGLNLQLIWNSQEVPEELQVVLSELAPQVSEKLSDTPAQFRNVGEFAKQQACWSMFTRTDFEIPEIPDHLIMDAEDQRAIAREDANVRRIDVDIELDQLMISLMGRTDEMISFSQRHGLLSPKSDAALKRLSRGQFNLPLSERSAFRELLGRMVEAGFVLAPQNSTSKVESGRERTIRISGAAKKQVRL